MSSPHVDDEWTGLWAVILVIGTLLSWATIANVLGPGIGFAASLCLAAIAGCVVWRDQITWEVLSNIGLVGVPVLVVGLSLS